jgi:hypothetical protein
MCRPLALAAALSTAIVLAACSDDSPSPETTPPASGAGGDASAMGGYPPMAGGPDGSTADAIAQWQGIAQQVSAVQKQAFADSAIDAERREVAQLVESVMAEIDSMVPQHINRFQEIEALMKTPEVQADSAAARRLLLEAEGIRDTLLQTQNTATAREDVAAKAAQLQEHVLDKMKEIDPNVPSMMERADSLSNVIRAAQSAGTPPPPAPADTGAPESTTP